MTKPIGGFFDIDVQACLNKTKQSLEKFFHLKNGHYQFLNLGRTALVLLFQEFKRKNVSVLLPDYLCSDVFLSVINKTKVEVKFYQVSRDFLIDQESLLQKIVDHQVGAVCFINYFGIVNYRDLIKVIKVRFPEIQVIEDCVQDPYALHTVTLKEQVSDYMFLSFKKAFPVVEGAVIRSKGRWKSAQLGVCNQPYISAALSAGIVKNVLLETDNNDVLLEKYMLELVKDSSVMIDHLPRKMSPFCYEALEKFDLDNAAKIRRRNYSYLVSRLKSVKAVEIIKNKILPKDVPLFCQVYVKGGKRNRLRSFLQEQQIYCPVHWPVIDKMSRWIGEDARFMANNMLSLVIDQRCSTKDLDRLIELIKKF